MLVFIFLLCYHRYVLGAIMNIDKKEIEELKDSANAIMVNELKTYYLLGDTNEYDDFEPQKVKNDASLHDLYKKACCMYAGYKIEENEEQAFKLWKQLAEQDDANSMIELSAKAFVDDKKEEGFALLQKAGKLGSEIAQYRFAVCNFLGYGTAENAEKAFTIIKKLAEQKFPNAVYLLGSFYFNDNGTFVEQDKKKGWELIKTASALGCAYAQYEVAIQYFIKQDKDANFADVAELMDKAAEGGDLRALYVMSLAYAKGEGVEADLDKAMRYLAQSYEGGFPLAIELMKKLSKDNSEKK